jgi:hypothetical protein
MMVIDDVSRDHFQMIVALGNVRSRQYATGRSEWRGLWRDWR